MAIGVQIALLFLLSCSVASARRAFPHATPPTSSLSPVTLLPSSFITPPPPPFLPLDPSPIKSTTTTPPFLQPRPVKPLFSKVSPRPPSPRRPQFKDDDDDQVQQKPNLNPFSASGRPTRPPPQGISIPNKPNFRIVVNGAGVAVALGLASVVLGYFFGVQPLDGASFDTTSLIIGCLLALPFFGLDQYLNLVQEDTMTEVYSLSIFGARSPLPIVVACASLLAFSTGVGEELLFRGFIQQGLINNIGTWPGLLIASALFGLAHSLVPSDLGFLVLFGAYCGISYVLSGNNVVVPIATHTVYDALVLLAAYYRGLGHMTDPRQKHLVPRDEEE